MIQTGITIIREYIITSLYGIMSLIPIKLPHASISCREHKGHKIVCNIICCLVYWYIWRKILARYLNICASVWTVITQPAYKTRDISMVKYYIGTNYESPVKGNIWGWFLNQYMILTNIDLLIPTFKECIAVRMIRITHVWRYEIGF